MFMKFFLQVHPSSNPGLIVLGVTAGYALKLRERIDHSRGAFLNPGSAGKFFFKLLILFRWTGLLKKKRRVQFNIAVCNELCYCAINVREIALHFAQKII